jgi:hypothetical protein
MRDRGPLARPRSARDTTWHACGAAHALFIHHTKSWKVLRVPLPRELWSEQRLRVDKFLSIEDSWGFPFMVKRHSRLPEFAPHQMRTRRRAAGWCGAEGGPTATGIGQSALVAAKPSARKA